MCRGGVYRFAQGERMKDRSGTGTSQVATSVGGSGLIEYERFTEPDIKTGWNPESISVRPSDSGQGSGGEQVEPHAISIRRVASVPCRGRAGGPARFGNRGFASPDPGSAT